VTAMAPDDFASTAGVITFAAGEDTKTIQVTLSDDSLVEADEVFQVNIAAAGQLIIDGPETALVTINDNEPVPHLAAADNVVTEGNAGTTFAAFPVTLSQPSNQMVTVNYNTADGTASAGSDYSATNGSLFFG